MIILGIESSCDDTSAAVLRDNYLLSNVIASQSIHEMYGGVVPELASRAHQQNIVPVVDAALKKAGISTTAKDGKILSYADAFHMIQLGIEIDEKLNSEARGKEVVISTANSKIKVVVIPTDEEVMIARDAYKMCILGK